MTKHIMIPQVCNFCIASLFKRPDYNDIAIFKICPRHSVKQIRHWSAAYAYVDLDVRLTYKRRYARSPPFFVSPLPLPHQHVLREYYVLWCGAIKPEPPPLAVLPPPATTQTSDLLRGRKSVSSFTTPYRLSIRSFIRKNTPWPASQLQIRGIQNRSLNQRKNVKCITLRVMCN